MAPLYGVDFSRGGFPGVAALRAGGYAFVGRYAVDDLSPGGRGITGPEYQSYVQDGVGVFLYWESSEGWMTGGFSAGVAAAQNAQKNIIRAGVPQNAPVYFACDFDAAESDQPAIDECLRGAASVLGWERVGLYAGYHVLKRAKANGLGKTFKWMCQTLAWSDDGQGGYWVLDGIHLYQYDTSNNFVNGVDCDLVKAFFDDYGQVLRPLPAPTAPAGPIPGVVLPPGLTTAYLKRRYAGNDAGFRVVDGKRVEFDPKGKVSLAWLKRCLATIPKGKSYTEGKFPAVKGSVRRAGTKDNKPGTDWLYEDGSSITEFDDGAIGG